MSLNDKTHYMRFANCFIQGGGKEILLDFKRKNILPRVKKCLGIIKGLCPASILDIGYGRGGFLYPLLEEFPETSVTVLDNDPSKIEILSKLQNGGVNISLVLGSISAIPFHNDSFDVVTALEVIEHLENPTKALQEIVRVSTKYSIISVPSKPDNNPHHLHYFSKQNMIDMCKECGARKFSFDWVNGHMVVVLSK